MIVRPGLGAEQKDTDERIAAKLRFGHIDGDREALSGKNRRLVKIDFNRSRPVIRGP